MNLDFDDDALGFMEEVRAFVRSNLDPGTREKVLLGHLPDRVERTIWQRALVARGWGAPAWPVEHGGPGWSVVERYLFDEVLSEEGAPMPPVFGMSMLAPVLMRYGTPQQINELLPRILNIDDWWCQGFSEPNAGSDLAAVRTCARLEGDEWVINGQKIWTTLAHQADRIFCLVRTEDAPKKQEGLSILLVSMDAPGITVKPIITIDGAHEVNEVFFDDVRIPAGDIVGQAGKGWDYAKYLLGHERTGIARVGQSKREIGRLKTLAAAVVRGGRPLRDDPVFSARIASLEIELRALELTTLRMVSALHAGAPPGSEANILKIRGSELQQDIAEAIMDAWGPEAFGPAFVGDGLETSPAVATAMTYFNLRKVSIYGGSNEIQRNILARSLMGL
ncbi:MAG: acyl-CoA dehydrogenase family protein [Brevundimonas sp.]|uniref:acyl-CoA dehydrogenase family protein n=1 Tax=Brevundimonas sp. TaxID=1871086 RepID=UPI002487019A|nr:acyl-CoA dehydrogenase family protein [Brevundimonas sp.]MDI1326235.1 acyl-CoA dehydrogenase family protein [Brevundimonas sp.]